MYQTIAMNNQMEPTTKDQPEHKPLTGFWVKIHSEILERRSIATLNDSLWRLLIELRLLLAYNAENGELPPIDDIAFQLRRDESQLRSDLKELVERGHLTSRDRIYNLPNFVSEQGPETAATRKAKSRSLARIRDKSQESHEVVTLCDTDKRRVDKKENRAEKKQVAVAPLVFPESLNTELFRKAWGEWEHYRRERNLPKLPSSSKEKKFKELNELGEAGAIEAIEYSVAQGWNSIFPKKSPTYSASRNASITPTDRIAERRAADRSRRVDGSTPVTGKEF